MFLYSAILLLFVCCKVWLADITPCPLRDNLSSRSSKTDFSFFIPPDLQNHSFLLQIFLKQSIKKEQPNSLLIVVTLNLDLA